MLMLQFLHSKPLKWLNKLLKCITNKKSHFWHNFVFVALLFLFLLHTSIIIHHHATSVINVRLAPPVDQKWITTLSSGQCLASWTQRNQFAQICHHLCSKKCGLFSLAIRDVYGVWFDLSIIYSFNFPNELPLYSILNMLL